MFDSVVKFIKSDQGEVIAHTMISAIIAGGTTSLLAGKSVVLLGVLISAGASPIFAAVTAIVSCITAAVFVILFADKYRDVGQIVLGTLIATSIAAILLGSTSAAITIMLPVVAVNLIFHELFYE